MSTPFRDEEKAFVRTILNNPAELTGWLVYADWLDERAEPGTAYPLMAEYLRLQVRLSDAGLTQTDRFGVVGRLEELTHGLDPDWLAIFDRPAIENCDRLFSFRCPKKWENLTATDDAAVRFCPSCRKSVHYCDDMYEARSHARNGECVAIALGVSRRPNDLREPEVHVTMGIMAYPPPPIPEPPPAAKRPWWKFR